MLSFMIVWTRPGDADDSAGGARSAAVGFVQARANRRGDVWRLAFRARARQAVQPAEHAAEAVQNSAALGAFTGVTLEARA
jgi:hypothetical protein